MNREELIKELHNIRPRGGIIPQKRAEAIDKAISDMEKLQKIEEIYKEYNILCSECPADRERGECNDCLVYNLENVFEGE